MANIRFKRAGDSRDGARKLLLNHSQPEHEQELEYGRKVQSILFIRQGEVWKTYQRAQQANGIPVPGWKNYLELQQYVLRNHCFYGIYVTLISLWIYWNEVQHGNDYAFFFFQVTEYFIERILQYKWDFSSNTSFMC